jgi:hypothetical protein
MKINLLRKGRTITKGIDSGKMLFFGERLFAWATTYALIGHKAL